MDDMAEAERLARMPSRLLAQAAAAAGRIVGDGLAAAGAHRYQYAVLATLAELGPASQAELSRRTGLDRSDMVATVGALEGEGSVARAVDAGDRRRNVVSLTDAGVSRLAALDAALAPLQERVLAPLAPEERATLVRLLQVLAGHHGRRWS